MSRAPFRTTAALAFVVLALGAVSASATAADPVPVPGIAPPGSDATAVYKDMGGRIIPMTGHTGEAAPGQRFGCTPVSGRDNPHRSGTGVAVSGHGWWDKVDVINEIDTAEKPMNQADVDCRVY